MNGALKILAAWAILIVLMLVVIMSVARCQDGTQDFYVWPYGDDANTGTSLADPWKTFKYAMATATTAGDTVFYYAGAYTYTKTSQDSVGAAYSYGWAPSAAVHMAAPGETIVFDWEDAAVGQIVFAPGAGADAVIKNIHFKDLDSNGTTANHFCYINNAAASLTFDGCIFDNIDVAHHESIHHQMFRINSADYFNFTGCHITNMARSGNDDTSGEKVDILLVSVATSEVTWNTFGDAADIGDSTQFWGAGIGVMGTPTSVLVDHNIAYGWGGYYTGDPDCAASPYTSCSGLEWIWIAAPNCVVTNNTVIRSTNGIITTDHRYRNGWALYMDTQATDVVLENNEVWGAGSGIYLAAAAATQSVKNNVIVDSYNDGILTAAAGTGVTLSYNTVYDCNGAGINIQSDATTLTHNTVMFTRGVGIKWGTNGATIASNPTQTYNVVFRPLTQYVNQSSVDGTVTCNYNLYWASGTPSTPVALQDTPVSFDTWRLTTRDTQGYIKDMRIWKPWLVPTAPPGRSTASPFLGSLRGIPWASRTVWPGAYQPWGR